MLKIIKSCIRALLWMMVCVLLLRIIFVETPLAIGLVHVQVANPNRPGHGMDLQPSFGLFASELIASCLIIYMLFKWR